MVVLEHKEIAVTEIKQQPIAVYAVSHCDEKV
jgi:hypothetical protein